MPTKTAMIYYGGFLHRTGGAFSHVRAIEPELRKRGWEVRVITLDSLPVWCRYVPHLAEKLVNLLWMPLGFLCKGYITRRLYMFFFDSKADLRIFEDVYVAWNSDIPSITILHAVWSDNLQAFSVSDAKRDALKRSEARIINVLGHPVVTVSHPYLRYLQLEHFAGALSKQIDVVELGVDQSGFKKTPRKSGKSMVFAGSLEGRKNLFFLLDVFQKVREADPDYTLTIIGDGPDRERLTSHARGLGLAVDFLGRLSHDGVLAELHRHAIYVHTSVKESFSWSLLEAKLAGLKTCAYARLQVPDEFIDAAVDSLEVDDWCRALLSISRTTDRFVPDKYTASRMTSATLRLALTTP